MVLSQNTLTTWIFMIIAQMLTMNIKSAEVRLVFRVSVSTFQKNAVTWFFMWISCALFCFRWEWGRIRGAACSCGEGDQGERRLLLQKVHKSTPHSLHTTPASLVYVMFLNDLSAGASCFIRRTESLKRRGSGRCIWRWWLRANFSC